MNRNFSFECGRGGEEEGRRRWQRIDKGGQGWKLFGEINLYTAKLAIYNSIELAIDSWFLTNTIKYVYFSLYMLL